MRFQRINPDPVGFSRLMREPAFRIFTSEEEMGEFYSAPGFVPPVNLKDKIAIGVFRGTCNSGGYSVRISDVRISNHDVLVKMALDQPKPWEASIMVMTSPSDLVTIERKPFRKGGLFRFKFMDVEGNVLHETEVFFPKT